MAKRSGTACHKSILASLDKVNGLVTGQTLEFNRSQCKYLSQEMEESARFLRGEEVKKWILKCIPTMSSSSPRMAALQLLHSVTKRAENLVLECSPSKGSWPKRALHHFAMKDHVQDILVHFRWWASVLSDLVINVPTSIPEKLKHLHREFEQGLRTNQKLEGVVLEDRKQLLNKVIVEIQTYTAAVKPGTSKKRHHLSLLKQVRNRMTDKDDDKSVELNEFTSDALLGKGSYGVVYRGKWCGVDCVLKQYQSFKRVDAEVESLKRLPHPHIVKLFRHWTNEKIEKYKSRIVMERMDKDLEELIEESCRKNVSRPFSEPVAIDIMLQVINGVRYMHRESIVHRDLKPKNVLVRTLSQCDFEVKLADLGTAREDMMSSNAEALTHKAGTTVYRAPELASREYTQGPKNFPLRSDVWSFGIMCFRIFTGRQPFEGIQSNHAIQLYIENGGRPAIPDDCPDYLKFVMERSWDKNPLHRPRAADLWRMLRVAQLRSLGILDHNHDLFTYCDHSNKQTFQLISGTYGSRQSHSSAAPVNQEPVSFPVADQENSVMKAGTSVVTNVYHGLGEYDYRPDYNYSPHYYSESYRSSQSSSPLVDHDNQPITNPNYMKRIKL